MHDTITITGNIATPPELKRTPGGVTVTTFRLASSQRRYDRTAGAWVETGINWYTVSAFRSLADHAFHSLSKGDRVIVTGRLRVRDWETETRRGTTVEVDAEALGHDLLWGTTSFQKDTRSGSSESGAAWAPSAGDDAWATPGTVSPSDSADTSSAAPVDAEPAELALVGADDSPNGGVAPSDKPF